MPGAVSCEGLGDGYDYTGAANGAAVTSLTFSGAGSINLPSGTWNIECGASGNAVTINVPITGPGGIVQHNFGTLYLYGTNTYSGGTTITGGQLTYYTNSASFGTGPITFTGTQSILNGSGGVVTLPNAWIINNAGGVVNFASGNTICTGPWTLQTTPQIKDNNATAPLTISGPISGPYGLALQNDNSSAIGSGTITLSGANTYTGPTGIGQLAAGGITTVSVSSINSVSTPAQQPSSSLGVPSSVANGTIQIGNAPSANACALIYTGPGETSDRVINLASTTAGVTIEMDGTGPLILTGGITATTNGAKTLTLQGSSTAANTISGAIVNSSSGATALTKAQAGTWVLGGANTYSGNTTVSAGTLRQGAASVIPNGSGNGTFAVSSGATFDLGGYNSTLNNAATAGTINNATGGGTPTLTIGANNTGVTISGQIKNTTGTLSLVKTGTGSMTLSGANTYAGGTTINAGSIVITSDGNLGATTGTLTLNCGTGTSTVAGTGLHFNAISVTLNASRGITLGTNGGCIGAAQTYKATLAGVITGTGNFQSGFAYNSLLGTNVLTGANTYSGTTTIAGGRLLLGASGSLPSGTPLTIASDTETNSATMAGSSGAGGILDLNGYSQAIGPLTSSKGIGSTGSATPTVVFSGGALTIQETSSSTFAGQFIDGSSAGSLTLNGPGALTLSGTSTYTGPTMISSGELLGATGGSCANSALTVSNGATNGVSITSNTSQWTCGSLTYNTGAPALDFNFGYSVTPSTSVAPLNVSGAVAFNGTPSVTVEAANLPPGTYPLMTWGSETGTPPSTATLPPHVVGSLSVGGVGNNTLYLTVTANTQPLRWTGATSSTWDVNVTTDLNWKDSTPTSTYYQETTLPGDAVIFDDTYITAAQNITLNTVVTPASVTFSNNNYNYTLGGSGGIAGSTGLLKLGTGTATLNFGDTYTGGTVIGGGTLSIASDADLGAVPASVTAGSIVISNAALSANTTLALSANRGITMLANSALDVASGQTLSYGGVIAGAYNLTKTGPGTLVLSANHNSYTGNTIISAGTLQTGGDHSTTGTASNLGTTPSSPTPNNITLAGGTLQGNNLNFAFMPYRGITLTADSGLSSLTNCATGIQGPIVGNYGLTISSVIGTLGTNGVVYLEGTNTYTGNTIINNLGILSLYYSGSISNSASISIAAGSGLDVSNYTNDVGAKAFSLVNGQSLIASGTGTTTTFGSANAAVINGAASGSVSLGSQPITLNYTPASFTGDATHPSLYVPQGTLSLNGNSFTVNNAAASPLGGGTYVLIQQASGSIASSGSYSVNVTGTGLTAGATASISVSGGTVNLVVVPAVVSVPGINSVTLSGTNLIFSGTNGPDSGTFHVLSSTNVALPLSNWTSIATGAFSPTGTFSVTNAVGVNPSEFFIIQIP